MKESTLKMNISFYGTETPSSGYKQTNHNSGHEVLEEMQVVRSLETEIKKPKVSVTQYK